MSEPSQFKNDAPCRRSAINRIADRIFLHPATLAGMTLFSLLIPYTESEVKGALIFAGIIAFLFLVCDDLLAVFLPILLLSTFVTRCYDSYDIFIAYAPKLIFLPAAILLHFILYPGKIRIGASFPGLCAVTAAVLLGGIGSFGLKDYLSPIVLYYLLGLGAGLVIAYLFIRPQLLFPRDYDIRRRFGMIMTFMGLYAVGCMVIYFIRSAELRKEMGVMIPIQSGNNLSTLLMLALPFPAWLSLRHKRWLPALFLLYGGLIFSGSRGGLLMGSIELLFIFLYLTVYDKGFRFVYPLILTVGCFVGVLLLPTVIHTVFGYEHLRPRDGFLSCVRTLLDSESLHSEVRYQTLERLGPDFLSNPIFGKGLFYRGNEDLYAPVKGAMNWYHIWGAQIIGSMGIVGICAYVYQLSERIALTFRRRNAENRAFFLSYLGLFLMSQVNPGEFCPIPYALLAVILFIFIDTSDKKPRKRQKNK